MHKPRKILVTGKMPRVTAGERDVVDALADLTGMPCENVLHAQRWGSERHIERLEGMSRYVAAVGMHDAVQLMDEGATDIIIVRYDGPLSSIKNRNVQFLADIAEDRGVRTLITDNHERLAENIHRVLLEQQEIA